MSRLIDKHILMEELQKATANAVNYDLARGLLEAQRIVTNMETVELFCRYQYDGEVKEPCVESPCADMEQRRKKMNDISICGIPFKVTEVDEIPADYKGEVIHGEITHSRAEILLRKSLSEELKHQALLHEWVHGVLVMIGYNELSSDEVFVQNLALAINQTFEIKQLYRRDI